MISNCCAEIVIQSTTYALLAYRDVKRQNLYFNYMFISKQVITYSGYKLCIFVSICEVLHITYENWEESYHSNQYIYHTLAVLEITYFLRMYVVGVVYRYFPRFFFQQNCAVLLPMGCSVSASACVFRQMFYLKIKFCVMTIL